MYVLGPSSAKGFRLRNISKNIPIIWIGLSLIKIKFGFNTESQGPWSISQGRSYKIVVRCKEYARAFKDMEWRDTNWIALLCICLHNPHQNHNLENQLIISCNIFFQKKPNSIHRFFSAKRMWGLWECLFTYTLLALSKRYTTTYHMSYSIVT